ncbi:hypothetical protein FHS96_000411 [Sphingomonas zeicaulis]|uniref:DUF3237 domain-containing protein n=1 Tax=Sphingomonas zeicaulis TaxID=1632740 RepID=UPI003D1CFDE1
MADPRIAFTALAAASLGAAPAAPAETPPALTYAFTVRVELAPPVEQGEIDGGRRRFVPITGGTITGPRLNGTVLNGGGDWQTIYPGGFTRVEARYFLKAADGTVIGIHNPGMRVASPEVSARIARGETVDPASYYFRSSPVFDPPPGKHQWLREKTFVGRGIRMPDHVLIQFYIVE